MEQKILIFRLIIFLCFFYNSSGFTQEIIQGNAKVIDGDTIHIGKHKIRLYGIDAPEIKQLCLKENQKWLCGESSKSALIKIINNNIVICNVLDVDRYKRQIAECFIGEKNINQYMVKKGWALAYRYYSIKYVEDELFAKKNRIGIWQSEFQSPWDYRKSN